MNQWNTTAKPKYCCWVLNYRCPLQCKICYIWQTRNTRPESTLAEKKRFISSLVGFVDQDFEFHLSGGEPLMTPEIFDIITHIRTCGFKTNLVTNGWLVDEKVAHRLADAGLESLTFSLDGISAKTHDFLRGTAGSYERIMQAIEIVQSMSTGMKTSIISLITAYNMDELIPLADWVEHNPALDMISFQAITQPFSQARDDYWFRKEENAFLWPQDRNKVGRIMEELKERRISGHKIGNQPNHFRAFKQYFEDPNRFLKTIKCNLGDYEFHVDPYGTVFFCCFTDPVGTITKDSVPDLWLSERTKHIREQVYQCRKNCHIMINCFYEDEIDEIRVSSAQCQC